MATTFTDLLKSITATNALKIGAAGVTGLAQGLGLKFGLPPIPDFQTSAVSIAWLKKQAQEIRKTTMNQTKDSSIGTMHPRDLMKEALGTVKDKTKKEDESSENLSPVATINPTMYAGELMMFIYDPKTKNKLPYYDTFPLVFPIDLKVDGFLGLNMHYLPPTSRARLMDSFYNLINNTNMDQTTRLILTYEILKGAAQFREYKPCVKRYLSAHIRSPRLTVHPTQWDMVLMLPTARFIKADQLRVWTDSLNQINGIKAT